MRRYFAPYSLLVLLLTSLSVWAVPDDLDGDGKPDRIKEVSQSNTKDTFETTKKVSIWLSGHNEPLTVMLTSSSSDLDVYVSNKGELIVDRSNSSSRDGAELDYSTYLWHPDHQAFCLAATTSGIPANQLAGEVIPSHMEVEHYTGCLKLGEDESQAVPVPVSKAP